MSANRAGLSYASLLTNGLNASDTNKLLQSMVEYLKEIAENADNQVVKGAYGNILGMSLSDFRSITNLTSSDIQTIAGNQLTYENLINEVNNQLSFSNLMSRSNISEMLNTAYSNALLGVASDFTSNPALYAMRQTLMFLAGEGTDINIPFVNAAGFGLDLNTTVGDLARMGLGITQGLGLVVNILQGLSASGGLDLGSWNARETTRRGNIGNLLSTVIGGTSTSTYVSNTNQSDMTNQTLSRAVDDSEETKKITNKNTQDDAKSAENAYEALTSASSKHGNGNEFFWVKDALLAAVYDTSNGGSIRTIDRNLSNLFTTVFGNQSVVGKGFVKSLMFTDGTIPVDVRNNYIKVAISSADSVPISIKATDALPVIIRSSDTTFKIAAESLNSLKQNSAPQTVTIASTSSAITINSKDIENGVKAAILALIGSESEDDRLSRFLDNASDDTKGIPIKVSSTPTTNNLNVIVKNSGTEKIPITSR